uniref:Kinetochore protein Spc24 n=1 Tax=Phytophthora ramorum TaxID=164328 RepID=H3HC33_PHYRM
MEVRLRESAGGDELSWPEVQDICGQLEGMFHDDAPKDALRLRALVQQRKDIANTLQSRQSSAQKQLAHLRANLSEWEEKDQTAKERNDQLRKRLQELDAIKRDMTVQLDRFRLNEQYPPPPRFLLFTTSKASLDVLLDKYEEKRQELVQYNAAHQNDIPLAKNKMALYASVTGIRWDFSAPKVVGDIHVPAKQRIIPFEMDPAMDHFTAANALWDKIDEAFDDIDSDL